MLREPFPEPVAIHPRRTAETVKVPGGQGAGREEDVLKSYVKG